MRYTSITDIGLGREVNQDAIGFMEKDDGFLAIVCDGIGGGKAGDKASRMSVDLLLELYEKSEPLVSQEDVIYWFKQSVEYINNTVFELSTRNFKYSGMGTTLVAVIKTEAGLLGFNIGDSRIYGMLQNKLQLLTHDQTFAYEMYLRNELTIEETVTHPQRHVLMNAIGIEPTIKFEVIEFEKPYETILICSDGLYGYASHGAMESALNQESLKMIRDDLLKLAYENGALDNVSLILIEDIQNG